MHNNELIIKEQLHRSTIPIVVKPAIGESLIGYTLRLDYLNGFQARTLLKRFLAYKNSKDIFCLLNKKNVVEYVENNFNFEEFSSLVNLPDIYEKISMIYKLEKQFTINQYMANSFFLNTEFKICPICIQEWIIPKIFFVDKINMCSIHGVWLIDRCTCGKKITLYSIKESLLCSNIKCNKHFYELSSTIDDRYPRHNFEMLSYYNFLLS